MLRRYHRAIEMLLLTFPDNLPGTLMLTVIAPRTVFDALASFYCFCRDTHRLPIPKLSFRETRSQREAFRSRSSGT